MLKSRRKIFYTEIYFLIFFLIGFYCLSANTTLALEIKDYPVIASQTITEDTKLPEYALYLFNAGMFIGFFAAFLSLIIAGVMYFLSPAKADFLADAKDRINGAISGLLILVLTYLIITTIDPRLSVFHSEEPSAPPPPAPEIRAPGVYFYPQAGCSSDRAQANTSSIFDLGGLRNHVNSVGVVRENVSYITILYDKVNLWGKCQYINPNSSCTNVDNFAASASIHRYNFNSDGDGVYFFRKPCFSININDCKNNGGGYYEVDNNEIKSAGIYIEKLEDLEFQGVPEEEKDCVEYNEQGECTNRSTPTLGGENISSIRIKGNYLVLLSYAGPGQTCESATNDSCQEFPARDDVNKLGPQQLKWENIRNNKGVIPSCVTIIPIQ